MFDEIQRIVSPSSAFRFFVCGHGLSGAERRSQRVRCFSCDSSGLRHERFWHELLCVCPPPAPVQFRARLDATAVSSPAFITISILLNICMFRIVNILNAHALAAGCVAPAHTPGSRAPKGRRRATRYREGRFAPRLIGLSAPKCRWKSDFDRIPSG